MTDIYHHPVDRARSVFYKIAEVAQDYWPPILNNVGAIAMAVAGLWMSAPTFDIAKIPGKPAGWFVVGAILLVIGAIGQVAQAHRVNVLETENESLTEFVQNLQEGYPEVMRSMLQTLAKEYLRLRDTERVSLYRHNGTAFVLMGRYARNPVHNAKGRVIYPDNQGCIGQAWRTGKCVATNLPDPTAEWDEYKAFHLRDYGVPEEVVNGLTMKSRFYAAFALDGPASDKRIAVVVIESTRPGRNALSIEQMQEILMGAEGTRLAKFLEIWEDCGPNLDYAKGEGF